MFCQLEYDGRQHRRPRWDLLQTTFFLCRRLVSNAPIRPAMKHYMKCMNHDFGEVEDPEPDAWREPYQEMTPY